MAKSFKDLSAQSDQALQQAGISTTTGRIAKSLVDIANAQISDYLIPVLERVERESFLGTAQEIETIQRWANLLNVRYDPRESIQSIKSRIVLHLTNGTVATQDAIRARCLLIPGVSNIKVVPLYYGAGTVAIFVEAQQNTAPNTNIIKSVTNTAKAILPIGLDVITESPVFKDVAINISIVENANLNSLVNNITNLLNNNDIGQQLATTFITNAIIGGGGRTFKINSITVNGKLFTGKIISAAENEKIVPSRFEQAVVVKIVSDSSSL